MKHTNFINGKDTQFISDLKKINKLFAALSRKNCKTAINSLLEFEQKYRQSIQPALRNLLIENFRTAVSMSA
jgi:hypothetical protein